MTSNPSLSRSGAHATPGKQGRALWLWAALIPALAIGVDILMGQFPLPLPMRIALAVLPLAPGILFVRALSQLFSNGDELAMRIMGEALAFVFFALLGVFICVDLLENGGVLPGFQWNTMKLSLTMAALVGVGTLLSARRYR